MKVISVQGSSQSPTRNFKIKLKFIKHFTITIEKYNKVLLKPATLQRARQIIKG